jgi:hypothetical protein
MIFTGSEHTAGSAIGGAEDDGASTGTVRLAVRQDTAKTQATKIQNARMRKIKKMNSPVLFVFDRLDNSISRFNFRFLPEE